MTPQERVDLSEVLMRAAAEIQAQRMGMLCGHPEIAEVDEAGEDVADSFMEALAYLELARLRVKETIRRVNTTQETQQ